MQATVMVKSKVGLVKIHHSTGMGVKASSFGVNNIIGILSSHRSGLETVVEETESEEEGKI